MVQHKPSPGNKPKKNSSVLKRLRSSLKEAGITGVLGKAKGSQTKKQRQGSNAVEAGKNQRGEKLALINDVFNPFEIKSSKSKHEVLGRKMKGTSGRPTLSKQIGIDNRKKTLLQDLKNRNRTGAIIDRRFGENNANMTPEEKMLERFTREKQKKARGSSLFNLEDDEEEEELTHFGQSLSGMDTFDDPIITDDEEDKGVISQAVVRESHFGGFEPKKPEDENRVKSKGEVMKELIAKSKFHKHERQKAKEDDETLRMELDEGLDEIKALLMSYESAEAPATRRQPLAPQSEAFKKTIKSVAPIPENDIKGAEYDRYLHEMRDAQRAQATDRLKTEEEIAMEEKAALEKAERHRIRRMNGEDSDSDEENDKTSRRRKAGRAAQADDLDDDLDTEALDNFGLGEGVKVRVIDPNNEEGSSEEEGSDEGSDDESEGTEDSEEDASDLECSPKPRGPLPKAKHSQPQASVESSAEIPFTFPIPQTTQDLGLLVNGRKPLEHETVIKRTRVLNHPKLAPENKEKLEKFMSVLLNHLENAVTHEEFSVELVNIYTSQITELAIQLPEAAARVACDFLNTACQQFREELSSGMEILNAPSPGQLIVFSLFTRLFSTSDYYHAVISPLQLFLGQCLLQAPISSARCIARSIYVCGLLYETQIEAKRFVPEVIASLCTILYVLAPVAARKELDGMPDFFYNRFQLEDNSILTDLKAEAAYKAFNIPQSDPQGLAFKLSFGDLAKDASAPQFKKGAFISSLLLVTLRQLRKFAELYATLSSPLSAFPQLFAPISSALTAIATSSRISRSLKAVLNSCQERIESLVTRSLASRTPLQMQAHRPLAIKTYLPKFDAEYSVDRYTREPNKEKASLTKLQRQHKREHRGAIRELRKDSQFLAREKLTTIKQKDAEYKSKMRTLLGEVANNQGDAAKFNYEVKAKKGRK